MSNREKPPTTTNITAQNVATLALGELSALHAGHLVAGARRDVADVGAVRRLGIPWVAQDVAVGIEGMDVAFPRVYGHLDMLSHPTP